MLEAAEPGNILQGSVLATLQSKLLSGAVGVLFGLLGKLGDKAAINAAAAYLGSGVYQLYRHLYREAGANEDYFALDAGDCTMGMAEVDMKLEETRFVHALKQQAAQKQTLKQKQKAAQEAKAAKAAKAGKSTTEAGRVGDRPYARGRSYKADRYDD